MKWTRFFTSFEGRAEGSGLNAGRWDYLFSIIKYFHDAGPEFTVPDRADIAITARFMRAYTELLIKTDTAMGRSQGAEWPRSSPTAVIPNRREPEVTQPAFDKVRADKTREANDGFDGS